MNKAKKLPVVLVVDDEPKVLETFAAILDEQFEVLTARKGKEALEIIARESINLVFFGYQNARYGWYAGSAQDKRK